MGKRGMGRMGREGGTGKGREVREEMLRMFNMRYVSSQRSGLTVRLGNI